MPSCQCEGIDLTFDEETVRRERKFYARDGVDTTTQWLIDAIQAHGVEGLHLLDVGGGLGGIQHQLLANGASHAIHVDASSAYLEGAQREAKERGLQERIEWHFGDFVDIASSLPPADIVTLDRVVCCYDDMHGLVSSSAQLAGHYYGLVLPRDEWWLRLGHQVINVFQRLFGSPFRVFVHPVNEVEAILKKHSLHKVFERRSFVWQVALYSKQ